MSVESQTQQQSCGNPHEKGCEVPRTGAELRLPACNLANIEQCFSTFDARYYIDRMRFQYTLFSKRLKAGRDLARDGVQVVW